MAAKQIMLCLWLVLVGAIHAPAALALDASENRTWKKIDAPQETRLAESPQVPGTHQEKGSAATELVSGCPLAAKTTGQLALPAPSVVPNAGGVIRSFVQETDQIYYRVSSGSPSGSFLTAVKPSSSAWAREVLALPEANTASFIQEVLVPAGTRLQRSRALPAFGRRGGAEQFEILKLKPGEYQPAQFGPNSAFE